MATKTVDAVGALATRAMLVDLDIHFWNGHKRDQAISDEVAAKHNTDGSYNKRLIPKAELKELWSCLGECASTHKHYTLPWSDSGDRIISAEAFFTYQQAMRKVIDKYNAAADAFAAKYKSLVAHAKATENHSFDPAHYPTDTEIRARYGVDIKYRPVPVGADLRINMSDDALSAVRASINEDQQARIQVAIQNIADRVNDVVGKMAVRLREYKPSTDDSKAEHSFRDSLVDNVKELADLLPALNITGDPKIEAMAAALKELAKVKPYVLRSDERVREKTAKAAEKILTKVSDFI